MMKVIILQWYSNSKCQIVSICHGEVVFTITTWPLVTVPAECVSQPSSPSIHTRKVDINNFDIAIVIITQLDHHFLSLIIKIPLPLILFFNIKPFIILATDGKQAAPVF